jgi:hypothetical protein
MVVKWSPGGRRDGRQVVAMVVKWSPGGRQVVVGMVARWSPGSHLVVVWWSGGLVGLVVTDDNLTTTRRQLDDHLATLLKTT